MIVAVVTGTWCPNCHDEAQFLVQLHRKYRDRGLEVVALDFEEPEQQEEGLHSSPGVHQEVRRRIPVSGGRCAGRDVGEGAAGE